MKKTNWRYMAGEVGRFIPGPSEYRGFWEGTRTSSYLVVCFENLKTGEIRIFSENKFNEIGEIGIIKLIEGLK